MSYFADLMYEYSGAIHVHSRYSDGTGRIEDIARAAAEAGLDYIIITDHNTLKPKEDGYERWINGVMVIIGYEMNDLNNENHYLTLGLDKLIGTYENLENGELGCSLAARDYVRLVNESGGFGFMAHPDERRHERGEKSYPWTHWEISEFTGIEIWNHMSEWAEGLTNGNKLERFVHPLKSISSPSAETLSKWDELSQNRRVVGIGGVDAHAFKENLLGLFQVEVFAYKVLFKSIRTHVLLDSPIKVNDENTFEQEKEKILNGLRNGRCFVGNYYQGDARGFRFYAERMGKIFNMGETVSEVPRKKSEARSRLKVEVPAKCVVKLIHNGYTVDEMEGHKKVWEADEPGVYRVECWKNGKGWIFSNHIRLM